MYNVQYPNYFPCTLYSILYIFRVLCTVFFIFSMYTMYSILYIFHVQCTVSLLPPKKYKLSSVRGPPDTNPTPKRWSQVQKII